MGTSIVDLTRSFYDRTEDPNGTMLRARSRAAKRPWRERQPLRVPLDSAPPRDLVTLIFPIVGPQGPLGQGRLVRDVTAERASERVKDEFVALVSHEPADSADVDQGLSAPAPGQARSEQFRPTRASSSR